MSSTPTIRYVQKETIYLVGIAAFGNFHASGQIPHLWQEFNPMMSKIPNRSNENQCFGIESYTDSFMKNKQWHYMPAVEVKDLSNIPPTAVAKVLSSNLYAVFTHKGKMEGIGKTFDYIYGTWLPKADYEIAAPFDFEFYDERYKHDSDDSEMDIYVPVRAKEKQE